MTVFLKAEALSFVSFIFALAVSFRNEAICHDEGVIREAVVDGKGELDYQVGEAGVEALVVQLADVGRNGHHRDIA